MSSCARLQYNTKNNDVGLQYTLFLLYLEHEKRDFAMQIKERGVELQSKNEFMEMQKAMIKVIDKITKE